MALIVTIFGKDKLSKKLRGIGKLVKGLALGFGKWDRIIRTLFIGVSIKLAADMQKGLREIGTLMGGLTDVEMKNMSHELQIVAARSGEAMKSLVKARYDIVSAGFVRVSESMQLLNASANLAIGGVTDVANAADLLTTTLNAYSLSSDQAIETSDKLFTIVRLGKTTMNELGGSMGRVLAIAGQAEVSLDEVGAALATLTAQGQSTEEATTAIRSAIVELLKPSEDLTGVIEELGFESGIALIKSEGFAGAIQMIKEQSIKSNIPMTDLFGNIRSMQAVLPLTGTAMEGFVKNLEEMKNSSGATALAVEEMQKSFTVQLNKLKANVANIMTEIGNVLIKAIQPKIEEANKIFETLGEIGWDKIGEFMVANWGEILTKLGEIAWIGAQIIGIKFKQGIEAILTPEWWDKFARALKAVFGLMTGDFELLRSSWQVSTDDMAVKVDELILKLQSLVTEGFDFVVKGAEDLEETIDKNVKQIKEFTTAWNDARIAFENYAIEFDETQKVISESSKKTEENIGNVVGWTNSLTSSMTNAAIAGEEMGDAVVSALKRIAATIVAKTAAFALLSLIPGFGKATSLLKFVFGFEKGGVVPEHFAFGGRVPEIKGFQFGGSSKDTVPAMLTPHEMVSTPEAAGMFGNEITRFNQMAESGFRGGGGDTFNITITAIDGADVERVIKRNPNSFARGWKDLKRRKFID